MSAIPSPPLRVSFPRPPESESLPASPFSVTCWANVAPVPSPPDAERASPPAPPLTTKFSMEDRPPVNVTSASSASALSDALRLMPSAPNTMKSVPPDPFIRSVSATNCGPRSIATNSISSPAPVSSVKPGAKGPPDRSISKVLSRASATARTVSVLLTVAVPHCTPPTWIASPDLDTETGAGPATLITTL